jgi:XTP/dITP diphosphohydrolase
MMRSKGTGIEKGYTMELIFATNNRHKLKEIAALLDERYELLGLWDLDAAEEIPEDHDTLEKNASQKAWHIYKKFGRNCFADDTGLEVHALNGAPGVYSARYARIGSMTFPDMEPASGNIKKLLLQMEGIGERKARFRTVIALVLNGKEYRFEGTVNGVITHQPAGTMGFGYDPVFRPDGYEQTFAEMELELKNRISHRARAVRELTQFLNLV